MVGARRVGDGKLGAEKAGRKLGDQFLDRVAVIAKARAEVTLESMLCATPMRLMPMSA